MLILWLEKTSIEYWDSVLNTNWCESWRICWYLERISFLIARRINLAIFCQQSFSYIYIVFVDDVEDENQISLVTIIYQTT